MSLSKNNFIIQRGMRNMIKKETVYTIEEFRYYIELTKAERIVYDFSKELEQSKFDYSKNQKLYKMITFVSAALLFLEKTAYASTPTTGYPEIDGGAWKIVTAIQACIFWVALAYSLKALLIMAIKGEGDFKNALLGILICIADYAIPSIFAKIPGLFRF
jgi:hypothetical protein